MRDPGNKVEHITVQSGQEQSLKMFSRISHAQNQNFFFLLVNYNDCFAGIKVTCHLQL